tara:strand:+ start:593 stop:1765 length:1173 start_codon:yes stop_codon:yes gene_type:complete
MSLKRKSIVFIINHLAFFVSHRLPIAIRALEEGYKVSLITGKSASLILDKEARQKIKKYDISIKTVQFSSAGTNPIREILGLIQISILLKKIKPNLVHCASPKGVIYGGIASKVAKIEAIVFAISGMGYAFTKRNSYLKKTLSSIFFLIGRFSFSHKNKIVIVQNNDDYNILKEHKLAKKSEMILIEGSGINLKNFENIDLDLKEKIILFPARIMKDKGIYEFVNAVKILCVKYDNWKFIVAGTHDYESPNSIKKNIITDWKKIKNLQFLGHLHTEDMNNLYKLSSIVCLPSYREGLPKSLLEAQAAGCPVITADTVGCRDAIINNETGYLVPPYNSSEIVKKIELLINNSRLRKELGTNGINNANKKFGIDRILEKIFNSYENLLNKNF